MGQNIELNKTLLSKLWKTHRKNIKQKRVEELEATYYWADIMGGKSVLLHDSGEFLIADSSICLEKHIQAYTEGKRS